MWAVTGQELDIETTIHPAYARAIALHALCDVPGIGFQAVVDDAQSFVRLSLMLAYVRHWIEYSVR